MRILRNALAVATCATKGFNRYALGGVLIERVAHDTCRAVATDGRILACVQWTEDCETPRQPGWPWSCSRAILSEQTCKAAARLAKPGKRESDNRPATRFVTMDEMNLNGRAKFTGETRCNKQVFEAETLEGHFPNCCNVFPESSETDTTIRVDPIMFAKLLTAIATAGEVNEEHRGVVLTIRDKISAITVSRVSLDNTVRVAGAIMPLDLKKGQSGQSDKWRPAKSFEEGSIHIEHANQEEEVTT